MRRPAASFGSRDDKLREVGEHLGDQLLVEDDLIGRDDVRLLALRLRDGRRLGLDRPDSRASRPLAIAWAAAHIPASASANRLGLGANDSRQRGGGLWLER